MPGSTRHAVPVRQYLVIRPVTDGTENFFSIGPIRAAPCTESTQTETMRDRCARSADGGVAIYARHAPSRSDGVDRRVVDWIVDFLAAAGVDYLFGVDGANIEDLFDAAFDNPDVTAVLAKHEFSAAAMADGYSRVTSGIGVVMATSGGGSLNLVAGLGESFTSSVPVLALIGQPPTALDGRGAFQDTSGCSGALDAEALLTEVSLYCRRVLRPDDIRTALPEALSAARVGGPAVLLLPKDIQQARIDTGGQVVVNPPRRSRHGDLDDITAALQHAAGPVAIIAGEQIAMDDARGEFEALRTTLRAQVATVPEAKDATCSTTSLGVTGVMGHPGVAEAIQNSGVCLLVGTRLAATARAGLDAALNDVTTLSLGSAPPYVPSTHVHSDDLRVSLPQLTRTLSSRDRNGRGQPNTLQRNDLTPPVCEEPGVRYRDAMAALDAALPDGADIVVDAGNAGAAAIHYLPSRRDGRFVIALGMGGMGYSFGAAIGIAFARRRRTVIIAGDGSFYMHGLELHTAIEYQLPVTLVLFNNNAHAMCLTREQIFYDGRYSYNRFRPSKIGLGLAAMFPGLNSAEVSAVDDLPAALSTALDVAGPSVVSIDCSADEIPPFAPFLNARQPGPTHHEEKKNVASRA